MLNPYQIVDCFIKEAWVKTPAVLTLFGCYIVTNDVINKNVMSSEAITTLDIKII